MSKQQAYIDELKQRLKAIPNLAGVWNQRTFPTRNVYPCAVIFYENETNESLGMMMQDHQRYAQITVAVFLQGTQDPEKVERDTVDLTDSVIKALGGMDDPLAYITYQGVTYGVQELDPEVQDEYQLIHRAELRFLLQYCENFTPYLIEATPLH